MWQTLRQKYCLTVRRDDVMALMAELDPSGVQLRARRRFIRRVYSSCGPNYVWHADGYDKLKPYGLAISGCIDGYSRKVLWLVCQASNNDPGVIAQNYVQCVSEFEKIPMRLRTDCGTENGTMVAMHCTLRSSHTDDFAGAASHMYGSSTANQRIESWWSYFRKQRSQFWMDLMNDLKERHLFNGSHDHTCLVRFVFMDMLQRDLDECKDRFGGTDCGFPVSQEQLGQFVTETNNIQCGDEHLQAHFENLQRQCGLAHPQSWESCVENYIKLKNMADL
ncbi:uncharacterized protein LOC116716388 isoform X2 [Xiphophorus hellerii]|uniref:uncharacterized protein LOC116716388 isoform X2 n=1 Tax=Xiphophorus hellerii TaxID=8084 RepID=UPI0013B4372B|nr:uncharacterized protein LOC116716388 isoform X2 [Xiphophorus hellerii]